MTITQSRITQRTPAGRALAAAASGQLVLLTVLAVVAGLGPAGLLAGLGYAAGLLALLARALHRAGRATLTPADLVTLGRAGLAGGVTATVADALVTGTTAVAALVGVGAVALVLDAVDGRVARATGTVSPLGARFDMEVDAFLVLVLSVQAAAVVGPWALAIGAMRYVFVAASWALPWLSGPLPPSYAAKTVAAVQGAVLLAVSSTLFPPVAAVVLVAAALAALCWSFGRSVLLLHRSRRTPTATPNPRESRPERTRVAA
ncbi:hypothetical protein BJF78_02440 [Pseudonocardia sp. CNS-139]|nr:hypothetical protein BJF78_02440 [Pseudonocardia sp. CNS-139]